MAAAESARALADPVSFPKIISGRIDDVVRRGSGLRQWCRSVGRLCILVRPSGGIDADAFDCSRPHKQTARGAGVVLRNNDVIQTLAVKCTDQALGYPVLPGRSWADRPVTDPHRRNPARENLPLGAVSFPKIIS
jgi:hypothetical protein